MMNSSTPENIYIDAQGDHIILDDGQYKSNDRVLKELARRMDESKELMCKEMTDKYNDLLNHNADIMRQLSKTKLEMDRLTAKYEESTPERLRHLNAKYQRTIYDLKDIISDKDDLIELLRVDLKTIKATAEIEKKQLEDRLETSDDKIAELREIIKNKNVTIKKLSGKNKK